MLLTVQAKIHQLYVRPFLSLSLSNFGQVVNVLVQGLLQSDWCFFLNLSTGWIFLGLPTTISSQTGKVWYPYFGKYLNNVCSPVGLTLYYLLVPVWRLCELADPQALIQLECHNSDHPAQCPHLFVLFSVCWCRYFVFLEVSWAQRMIRSSMTLKQSIWHSMQEKLFPWSALLIHMSILRHST